MEAPFHWGTWGDGVGSDPESAYGRGRLLGTIHPPAPQLLAVGCTQEGSPLTLLACPAYAHALGTRNTPRAKEAGVPGHKSGTPTASATQPSSFTCQLSQEQLRRVSPR